MSNETQGSSRKKAEKSQKKQIIKFSLPCSLGSHLGKTSPRRAEPQRGFRSPRGGSHPKTHTPFSPRAPFLGRREVFLGAVFGHSPLDGWRPVGARAAPGAVPPRHGQPGGAAGPPEVGMGLVAPLVVPVLLVQGAAAQERSEIGEEHRVVQVVPKLREGKG